MPDCICLCVSCMPVPPSVQGFYSLHFASNRIVALPVKNLQFSITLEDQNCPKPHQKGKKLRHRLAALVAGGRVSIKAQAFPVQVIMAMFLYLLPSPDWSKLFRTRPTPSLKQNKTKTKTCLEVNFTFVSRTYVILLSFVFITLTFIFLDSSNTWETSNKD